LFLLQLCLLLQLVDTLAFANFIVTYNPFTHLVVIRIHEFSKNFLLLFILFLELFVESFYLANFSCQLKIVGFKSSLLGA
jgi:hypothetical protein